LASVLLDSEADYDALLKRSVHDEMQTFVQLQLRQIIAAVSKKSKNAASARQLLLNVRAITADWAQGVEPSDPLISGQEKKKITLRAQKADSGDVPGCPSLSGFVFIF
jgi:hypothetical protein